MLVSHLGRFSVICTATRQGSAWRGSARIKPAEGAPEPFTESPTYLASATFRSEAAAEAAVQKEVMTVMRKLADQGRALDSLLAESGMRNDANDKEEDFF